MAQPHPLIGAPKSALDTPALLVDLDVLEANIKRIADTCRAAGVGWRPHMKGHKTPEIARLQLAAGAIGVTCAKVGEAEVMAAAGIRNILIANEIVGPLKVRRLVDLVGPADPIVGVDSIANATELAAAARAQGKTLKVAIEVNTGMNRAGVEPGAPVVALANEIAKLSGLRLVGLFGWESQATTIAEPAEKERVVVTAVALLAASARAAREAGHTIDIVSCGGTGTFPYCARQPGVSEIQVGGAIFSDMHYRTHYHTDFPFALTVLATVISRPTPTRIILDAGRKDAELGFERQEHGFVVWRKNQQGVNLDRTWLMHFEGSGYWAITDLPYPKKEGGGLGRLFRYPTPIDRHHTLVWNYRMQKMTGWKRDLWRFLYKNRGSDRGVTVLEQDRAALVGIAPCAGQRENLLQCDIGVANIRRLYRQAAEAQFAARANHASAAQ